MIEYIKQHKLLLATVIYAAISLYVLFSQPPKSFEKYSLATNTLLLIGLFIMVAYQAVPSSNIYVAIIFATLIVSAILFYIFPLLSDSLSLIFNLTIVGVVCYLLYKYVFSNINIKTNLSNLHFSVSPLTTAIFLSFIGLSLMAWFYPVAERKMEGGGKIVLDEPVHLSSLRSIGNYKELNGQNDNDDTHNYHYSVSFWAFIHSQPGRDKYTPIFNYGEKPVVEYNPKKQRVRIRVVKKTIYEGPIVPQKWTNFVVTYDRGITDVFIDAKLVATEGGVVPYMTYDVITVGENDGISGGIGNVRYYDLPVSKSTIDYNYKKFKSLNDNTLF